MPICWIPCDDGPILEKNRSSRQGGAEESCCTTHLIVVAAIVMQILGKDLFSFSVCVNWYASNVLHRVESMPELTVIVSRPIPQHEIVSKFRHVTKNQQDR